MWSGVGDASGQMTGGKSPELKGFDPFTVNSSERRSEESAPQSFWPPLLLPTQIVISLL